MTWGAAAYIKGPLGRADTGRDTNVLVQLNALPSLPKSFEETLYVRRGICHLIDFLSVKSQRVVSDIFPRSGKTAGQEEVTLVLFALSYDGGHQIAQGSEAKS